MVQGRMRVQLRHRDAALRAGTAPLTCTPASLHRCPQYLLRAVEIRPPGGKEAAGLRRVQVPVVQLVGGGDGQ